MAFRLALQWGILDPIEWLESLPDGALDCWLAWDKIEPMGEHWMQTASMMQSILLPTYAKAGMEIPDPEDLMPQRYKRPKKRLTEQLFRSSEAIKQQAERTKAMFGASK